MKRECRCLSCGCWRAGRRTVCWRRPDRRSSINRRVLQLRQQLRRRHGRSRRTRRCLSHMYIDTGSLEDLRRRTANRPQKQAVLQTLVLHVVCIGTKTSRAPRANEPSGSIENRGIRGGWWSRSWSTTMTRWLTVRAGHARKLSPIDRWTRSRRCKRHRQMSTLRTRHGSGSQSQRLGACTPPAPLLEEAGRNASAGRTRQL